MSGKAYIGIALIVVVIAVSELALRRHRQNMAQRSYLRNHGKTVTGTIIDTRRVKRKKSSPVVHYAKVTYTVKGRSLSIANTWPIEEQTRLKKGTKIEVLYDPSNPSNACVSDSDAFDVGKYAKGVRTFEIFGVAVLAVITILVAL